MSFALHSTRSFDHAIDLSSSINKSVQSKYQLSTSSSFRTPRSSGKNSSIDKPCTIASVVEGRGTSRGHIGLAFMNLRQADVELNEFIDSSTYSRLKMKLLIAEPVEVIVAENFLEKSSNAAMLEMIRSSLPDATITTVHRRFFNHLRGAELVTQLANAEVSNCDSAVLQKEFCMQSCCALIKYIEQIQNIVFTSKALRFLYRDIEKMCLLDVGSWSNLEIVNTDSKKARSSLLAIVDETLTSGGSRLLRSNLLQPSADQHVIDQRLDAVEELVDNPHVVGKLRQLLDSTFDLVHFFNVFTESPQQATVKAADFHVTQLLRLKQILAVVPPLRQLMRNFKCNLLNTKSELLNDDRIDAIKQLLDERLHSHIVVSSKKSSLNLRHQRCYAIKEGVSVNLDIARRAYEELLRDVEAQEVELSTHLPGENTRMAFSTSRGFHYVWVCKDADTVVIPSVFINVVRNRSSVTFTSRNLVRYNDRIEQSISEVMIATDVVVQHVIKEVRPLIAVLYHVLDCLATTDMLCSFAAYAFNRDTVRPRFGSSIILNEGRHPLLDYSIGDKTVSNDTYIAEHSRIMIITGPNMTGKSTYLKQVCQLCVLAQSGCFIPAKFAILPVFQRIFSRVGHNDSIARNLSAFALEMDEIAFILQYSNNRTLVVIDELARSTSTEEGIAISFAIIEKLLKHKTFTIMATHFLDLAALGFSCSAVENYHFPPQVTYIDGQEVFCPIHQLRKGPYNGPLYGFELVELSTFPEEVIESARMLAQRLHEECAAKRVVDADTLFHHAMVRCAHSLRQVCVLKEGTTREGLVKSLKDIRKQLQVDIAEAKAVAKNN